jgi:hypothetical protein
LFRPDSYRDTKEKHNYAQRAIVYKFRTICWVYKERFWATDVTFDEAEITEGFKQMAVADGKAAFELVCEVAANNTALQFILRNGKQEIILKKVMFDVYDRPVNRDEPWGFR